MANTTTPERHPHIRAASGTMRDAKEEFRNGTTDFRGRLAVMRDVAATGKHV